MSRSVSLRPRTLPAAFTEPCLPASTKQPPSGNGWLHEIKHDGFRVIARKNGNRVRLYSRPGNDLTRRFPRITEAVARLRARSCIIDGEAVACGPGIRATRFDERSERDANAGRLDQLAAQALADFRDGRAREL